MRERGGGEGGWQERYTKRGTRQKDRNVLERNRKGTRVNLRVSHKETTAEMQRRRRRRRRRCRRRRRGEWLSGFENELLKNSITVRREESETRRKGRNGPGSGNGGASSDWSGREEIASRLVIITPLTQLPSPPIALPIIFVIEPFGARATKSPSSGSP